MLDLGSVSTILPSKSKSIQNPRHMMCPNFQNKPITDLLAILLTCTFEIECTVIFTQGEPKGTVSQLDCIATFG